MNRSLQQNLFFVLAAAVLTVTAQAQSYTHPKVRAITAFVRLEQASHQQEIAAALSVLRAVKKVFDRATTSKRFAS